MSDWLYVVILGCLVVATLFIPVYRWLALIANVVFFIGLSTAFLMWKSTGDILGGGWSTLLVLMIPAAITVHLFMWFMSRIQQKKNSVS